MKLFVQALGAWFRWPSWKQIFVALILGILVGVLAGSYVDMLKPIGSLFINAIHMIVAPVVFTAIVTAILSIKQESNVRRISMRAIILYIVFMMLSATIGCLLAYFIEPGKHFHSLLLGKSLEIPQLGPAPTVGGFIENLLPSNPVMPFIQGNVLQLILFAVLFATAIKLTGPAAEPVSRFFVALNKVVYQLTALVIWFAPYGIFALIAWTVGHFGVQVIAPLLALVGTVYLGCMILLLGLYPLALSLLARTKPRVFYRAIFPALAFAFTSSSSAATLPMTMRCSEENLGLPPHITKFLLPLGASFNLNGLSVYLSVATVFAANLYGVHLGLVEYLTIVLTITLTAMGAAAVPGSALIVMSAVMSSVGIPLSAIGVIAGVDRLNDMMQTSTNVAGDVCVSVIVAKNEKEETLEVDGIFTKQ
jgi:Na+/H+-dicarboxylate symporter